MPSKAPTAAAASPSSPAATASPSSATTTTTTATGGSGCRTPGAAHLGNGLGEVNPDPAVVDEDVLHLEVSLAWPRGAG